MSRSTAKVYETPLSEQENGIAGRKRVLVHLRLDIFMNYPRVFYQCLHLNFIIEMTDIAYNGLVIHFFHMFDTDDIAVTRGCHEDVALRQRILKCGHFITFHDSL